MHVCACVYVCTHKCMCVGWWVTISAYVCRGRDVLQLKEGGNVCTGLGSTNNCRTDRQPRAAEVMY